MTHVVSSHEKRDYFGVISRCAGTHARARRRIGCRRGAPGGGGPGGGSGRVMKRGRRGPALLAPDSRVIRQRRSVSAYRLPQCALYSPTLKESHALTSSRCSPRKPRRTPAREEIVRGHFTRRPLRERRCLATDSRRTGRDHRETFRDYTN